LPPELPPELREGANPATPLIFNQADLEMIRRDITDPVRMQARQSVYSALVAELRKVPGLVVVNADPVDLEPSAHHYRITVGAQISMQPDFRVAPISSRNVVVALNAEQLQPGGKGLPRASSGMYVDLQENCVRIAGSQSTCVEIQSAAREFVNKLRLEAFPPEPAATRPLFARLEDSSLDVAQRLAALADLYKLQVKTGETGLLRNAGAVRAVIELAKLVDPAQRAQLWRSVRGVADPALVDALLLSLAQDPAEVRIAAIEALASGSRSDPRVRSTLEAVEISDSRPLVRAIAGRALSGEETWRSYVASSLEDTSLSPEQRLEALVYYLYPPEPAGQTKSHPDFSQIIKDMDDNAVRAFADAMPRAGRLPGGVNNNLLGNFAAHHLKNPAINDMLLEMLGNHPDPRTRMGAVQLLGQSQPNVPRVRAALLKALQDDPDAGVRSYIRQVLGDKAP
jgi:hypothetical protein